MMQEGLSYFSHFYWFSQSEKILPRENRSDQRELPQMKNLPALCNFINANANTSASKIDKPAFNN